jgi:hypothetical protein
MKSTEYYLLFSKMSNKELLKEYKARDQLIHGEYCCYSLSDLRIFDELCREMDRRED